jgi:cytidylate kinase
MGNKRVEILVVEDYTGKSSELEKDIDRMIEESGEAEISVVRLHLPIWIGEESEVVGVHILGRQSVAEA